MGCSSSSSTCWRRTCYSYPTNVSRQPPGPIITPLWWCESPNCQVTVPASRHAAATPASTINAATALHANATAIPSRPHGVWNVHGSCPIYGVSPPNDWGATLHALPRTTNDWGPAALHGGSRAIHELPPWSSGGFWSAAPQLIHEPSEYQSAVGYCCEHA